MGAKAADHAVPAGWTRRPALDIVRLITPKEKVAASQYHATGRYPVLDQGQSAIAGYVDDFALVHQQPLPVIVFGDHTRTWKYASHPFAVGADGTKLLHPSSEVDPRFCFHAFSTLQLKNLGYSRHFKLLRELSIPIPPLPEQRKIAAILSSVDETIEKTEAVIERLDVVKKAMLKELLTRGMPGRHSRFKETEIGVAPEGWGLTPLGDAGRWMSGGTPSKGNPELWQGAIPWVSPKDMKRARISDAIDHVSESAIGNGTALVPAGAILIVVRGMILAHSAPVAITERPVCFNQDMKALLPYDNLLPEFVLYWMQAREEALLRTVDVANHGTKRMPSELLFALPLPVPELGEQRDICAALDAVDARLAAESVTLQSLEQTKRCLSAQLLSGEIRVSP